MSKLASLVADDDLVSRRLMRLILERCGHDVIEAESGGDALLALSSYRLDFAVLDLIMPDKGGLQTVRAFRALERSLQQKAIPIFGYTAGVLDLDIAECLSAGFSEVVTKPVELPAVMELLRRHGLDTTSSTGAG